MAKEKNIVSKDMSRQEATGKARSTYEQIRFAPVHGTTPMAPEMEAKPSSAGLLLGLAGSAVGAIGEHRDWLATDAGTAWKNKKGGGTE